MTDAMIGYGTTYRIWDRTLPVPAFVDVGEVINVTPPGGTSDRVDATHMKSPGRRREYIAGLIDSGEASFEINWVPGNPTDERLRALQTSGEVVPHQIEWINGVMVTYDAAVTGFEKGVPIDDRMTGTVTVAPSGEEDWGTSVAPVNQIVPGILGVAQVGKPLHVALGQWTGSPVFSFQWKRDGTNIATATDQSYTPVAADVGKALTVALSGTNSAGGPVVATSAETALVIAA